MAGEARVLRGTGILPIIQIEMLEACPTIGDCSGLRPLIPVRNKNLTSGGQAVCL